MDETTGNISCNPLAILGTDLLIFFVAYKIGKKKGCKKAWSTAWKAVERYYSGYKPTAQERTEQMFEE